MANTKAAQSERGQSLKRREREDEQLQPWRPAALGIGEPFEFMARMSDEMDRAFERLWRDVGLQPRQRSWWPRRLFGRRERQDVWAPRIEAFQKGDRFVVRAELPGLKKEDVEVELTDDALTIRGERREEREEERDGYFHSEREYGGFHRVIPLPEGVIGESAQASFRNGVLEVSMQAPPEEARRGRRIEITEGSQP